MNRIGCRPPRNGMNGDGLGRGRRGRKGTAYLDPGLFLRVVVLRSFGCGTINGLTLAGRSNVIGATEGGSLAILHLDEWGQRRGGSGGRKRHEGRRGRANEVGAGFDNEEGPAARRNGEERRRARRSRGQESVGLIAPVTSTGASPGETRQRTSQRSPRVQLLRSQFLESGFGVRTIG